MTKLSLSWRRRERLDCLAETHKSYYLSRRRKGVEHRGRSALRETIWERERERAKVRGKSRERNSTPPPGSRARSLPRQFLWGNTLALRGLPSLLSRSRTGSLVERKSFLSEFYFSVRFCSVSCGNAFAFLCSPTFELAARRFFSCH